VLGVGALLDRALDAIADQGHPRSLRALGVTSDHPGRVTAPHPLPRDGSGVVGPDDPGGGAPHDEVEGPYAGEAAFVPARRRPLLHRIVPVAQALEGYRPAAARRDLTAALTVAALAIPSAMAYAELAGATAVAGLYALLLPTVAYALLGSSRQLIVGPEGSLAALVAASVLAMAAAGSAEAVELASLLALMVGACFLVARLLRLGWIADYLSRPVLVGYIHGVAVVLVVGQLGKLLGLDIEAIDPLPQLVEVARELGDASTATVAVGAVAIAVLLPLRFAAPRLPAALLVVVAGIAASAALDLDVAVVGDIPSGLPELAIPSPPLADALQLVPAAVGLFLVTFADEILTARSFAGRRDEHVDVGAELLATGAANAAAGLSQGIPVGASGSRTAVNDAMGAHSQLAGLLAAGAVALVLVFLTGPIADLPKAVLGAVIVVAAVGLFEPAAWRELWAADRVELAIAAVAAAGVVVVGVLEAIVFAVGLAIIDVVRRSARPHDAVLGWVDDLGRWADVSLHRSARVTPGVVVYRLDDRLFFANAGYVKGRVAEAIRAAPTETRRVVFDAEATTHVDAAGLAALDEIEARLRGDGIELVYARLKGDPRDHLGPGFPTVRAAVAGSPAPGEPPPPNSAP
jgi:SulP family sulfate permease